ncbi:hypothetical protein C2I19_17445 [Chromobacterium alticapitis]|uniref:Uncharacterized protein n=1 Tax=Chromobacterium alticapitis TaxID=2073169 RepID=A0A2S5DCB5_9NEIS|nr:hypothetical protein C2I19_17445 [Chromobacterium alticapitis]
MAPFLLPSRWRQRLPDSFSHGARCYFQNTSHLGLGTSAKCRDSTYGFSRNHRGICSCHGVSWHGYDKPLRHFN